MQTKEQIKNWKVVASVATAAALGVTGLGLASPGNAAQTPPPIEIEDKRFKANAVSTATTNPGFEIVPGSSLGSVDSSLDSPLASSDLDSPDTDDTPADDDSPEVEDSPEVDDSPEVEDSPEVDDSPEVEDSPEVDDSVESVDSLDS